MPWYRSPDGQSVYHLRAGRRGGAPAACRGKALPDDNPRVLDGTGCGRISRALCDAPVGDSSCDMPICEHHRTHVDGKDLDYCPRHRHLAPNPLPLGETS